jgi:rSAM/selenodomain-associated transferase 1
MNRRSERLLIIFSKNPVAGRVKTRLAAAIGPEEALKVYEALRGITDRATKDVDAQRALFYSDFIPESDLFLDSGTLAFIQEGDDLGDRMHRAFLKGFSLGYNRIVLIGTDCPELTPFIVDLSYRKLETTDVVLGPARDGGFYLIGLKRPFPEIFLGRRWGTPRVLNDTLSLVNAGGAEHSLLPALSDIDTIEDLKASHLWVPEQD